MKLSFAVAALLGLTSAQTIFDDMEMLEIEELAMARTTRTRGGDDAHSTSGGDAAGDEPAPEPPRCPKRLPLPWASQQDALLNILMKNESMLK